MISDITFYPSRTTHGYDLYASAADKEDILFLNLSDGTPINLPAFLQLIYRLCLKRAGGGRKTLSDSGWSRYWLLTLTVIGLEFSPSPILLFDFKIFFFYIVSKCNVLFAMFLSCETWTFRRILTLSSRANKKKKKISKITSINTFLFDTFKI